MISPTGATVLACVAVFARLFLTYLGWHNVFSSRIELTSPIDSIERLKEGAALVKLGMSPYSGSVLHTPPLVLFVLTPVLEFASGISNATVRSIITVLPFVIADLLTAAALFVLATRVIGVSNNEGTRSGQIKKAMHDNARTDPASIHPATVSALYLMNPVSIAACVAGSTSGFGVLFFSIAAASAAQGDPILAGAAIACAAYLNGLPSVLLLVPIASLVRNGIDSDAVQGKNEKTKSSFSSVIATVVSFTVTLFGLLFLSTVAYSDSGTTLIQWVNATYGFTLLVTDLTPNLGIYWYLFAELFEHFTKFFLFAFHGFPVFLSVPLFVRHGRDKPMLCLVVSMAMSTALAAYPTWGSVASYLAFAPLPGVVQNKFSDFLVAAVFIIVATLAPIFWHLWIDMRVANANFFFAVTLAHFAAQAVLVVGWLKNAAGEGDGGVGDGEIDSNSKRSKGEDKNEIADDAEDTEGNDDDDVPVSTGVSTGVRRRR